MAGGRPAARPAGRARVARGAVVKTAEAKAESAVKAGVAKARVVVVRAQGKAVVTMAVECCTRGTGSQGKPSR